MSEVPVRGLVESSRRIWKGRKHPSPILQFSFSSSSGRTSCSLNEGHSRQRCSRDSNSASLGHAPFRSSPHRIGSLHDAARIDPQAQAETVRICLHSAAQDRLVLNLARPDHSLTDDTCLLSGRPPDPHLPGRRDECPLLEPLADFLIERRLSLVSGTGAPGRFLRHVLLESPLRPTP